MKSDRYLRARAIFDAAEEMDPKQRDGFLREICEEDEELRSEVESLLAARDGMGDFLDTENPDWKGRRIGAYAVRDVVAEGGMGLVLRATQESPRRDVAIKLVRGSVFTEDMLRRFQLEAEVLGRLDHPGIARILEAGAFQDETGTQPYLVMEFIEGVPIVEAARGLDRRQRVEMMERVCEAVHHAHMRGVIHRDLKPSNILVRRDGTPKVLDFGVARVTDADVQLTTMHTRVGQIIGTLPYMSPEQVRGQHAQLDARSDVYALGVLLFEVLSGKLPYDLRDSELVEAARIINEDRPTRLGDSGVPGAAELEVIVGKCLRKQPENRYDSAAELGRDLRRFLRHEPILARAPSATYQLKKFARRNRGLVAAVCAAFVALVVGLVVATAGWTEASRERARSQLAADQAEAVSGILTGMLAAPDPVVDGEDVRVVDVLARAEELVREEHAGQPLVAGRVYDVLADTHHGMGRIESAERLWRLSLAEYERGHADRSHESTAHSRSQLARVLIDQGRLDGADSLVAQFRVDLERLPSSSPVRYRIEANIADLHEFRGNPEAAVAVYRRLEAQATEQLGPDHEMTESIVAKLGNLLWQVGEAREARTMLERLLEAQVRKLGPDHDVTASVMNNLAMVYQALDEDERARDMLERVIASRERTLGRDHPSLAVEKHNLADLLRRMGDVESALVVHRDALRIAEATLAPDEFRLAAIRVGYARSLREAGRLDEALPLMEQGAQRALTALGDQHPGVQRSLRELAEMYRQVGDLARAEEVEASIPAEDS